MPTGTLQREKKDFPFVSYFQPGTGCRCIIWLLPRLIHCLSATQVKWKHCRSCRKKKAEMCFLHSHTDEDEREGTTLVGLTCNAACIMLLLEEVSSLRNNSFSSQLNVCLCSINQSFDTEKWASRTRAVPSKPQNRSGVVTILPIPNPRLS